MNAIADNMPSMESNKTVEEVYTEFIKHQLDTGTIEKSTYTNSYYSYIKYIRPYLGSYTFATLDRVAINAWLTKLFNQGLSQNTIHTTYARLKKVYNHFYETGELIKNPFVGVKTPKKGTPKISHLTKEQMDDVLAAVSVLKDADFVASLTSVLAVAVPDEPGGLDKMLQIFADAKVNIEYMYAFIGGEDAKHAYMIFRVTDTKDAEAKLKNKGLKIMTQEEMANL